MTKTAARKPKRRPKRVSLKKAAKAAVAELSYDECVEELQRRLLSSNEAMEGNQVSIIPDERPPPVTHSWAGGIYLRQLFMRGGSFVIGARHKTEHFNIVLTGRATVLMEGQKHEIVAPCIFVSQPGVKKLLWVHEDMWWGTIHVTDERDLNKIEEMLTDEPPHKLHAQAKESLRKALEERAG